MKINVATQATQPTSRSQTHIENNAEQKATADKIHMNYGIPSSELFVALIARAVTFLVRGVSIHPNRKVEGSLHEIDPSEMKPSELLEFRKNGIS
ncbi:MAG: hypothetical protein P0S96_01725 [Simkaniaceae bacterium]|nr:hypothetical protein [Candidatus Sacchlamyda saccharinae]